MPRAKQGPCSAKGLTETVLDEVAESSSSPLSSLSSSAAARGRSTRSGGSPAGSSLTPLAGLGFVAYSRGRDTLGSRPTLHGKQRLCHWHD